METSFTKLHNKKFDRGKKYEEMKLAPIYIISFVDFSVCEYPEYLNEYNFLHTVHATPLSEDVFRIIFVELPKLKEMGENPSKDMLWCGFFQNKPDFKKQIEEYPMTNQAIERVNSLVNDNDLYSAYAEHLEWFNDHDFQLKATAKKSEEKGIGIGKEEGLDEGSLLTQAILDLKDQGKTLDEVRQILKDRNGLEKYLPILFRK